MLKFDGDPPNQWLMSTQVQALGPESVGDADRGKLGDGDRDDALRVLGRVIRAAKRLDAATSKQKVPRPRPSVRSFFVGRRASRFAVGGRRWSAVARAAVARAAVVTRTPCW